MRLTDISIRALKPPERGQTKYFDDTLTGFGVRISQGGTKTYFLMHGRARTLTTIGRVGIVSLAQARDKAKTILSEKQLGRYQAPTISFGQALDLYFSQHIDRRRARYAKETRRLLTKHFLPKLRHEKLGAISRPEIAKI